MNASRRSRALVAVALLGLVSPVLVAVSGSASAAEEWEPGTPPLSTPWTDEVGPDNALPEYPRPQLVRSDWENLNGVWQFAAAEDGEAPPFGQDLEEEVLVPYPVESALSGIQRREDRMWYRRTFEVPQGWQIGPGRNAGERRLAPKVRAGVRGSPPANNTGQRLRLNFEAVDHDTTVWVDGTEVGTHQGGYDSFGLDVTDALEGDGPHELVVGVADLTDETWQPIGKQRNVPDRGIFYTSASGIWQSVWMEPVAGSHIERLRTTPDLDDGSVRVSAVTDAGAGARVEAVAYANGQPVGEASGPADGELRVPVPDAKLWSPDDPYLYDLEVTLLEQGKPVDKVESYFGMREVGTAKGEDGKLYMTLNGEILFNMSTLDQGYWPDGIYTAPTDDALRFDVAEHKRLGFNTIRKHIKVEPDRWYYWADRLGLMVWQDMPSMRTGGEPPAGVRDEFERQLHEIVEENSSWTSITTWVPFNEGWGEWTRADTGRIADEVKALDPSRLVNAHSGVNCCASHGDSGRGDIIDYHQYLGPASPVPTADRVAADGEHGGFGLEVEDHMWFGEGHAYEMTPDSETLTRRYVENQQDLLTVANQCGMSAGVYTQFTDVEHEVNGFYTYDRQVEKMDFGQVRTINQEIIEGVDGSGSDLLPSPNPGTPGLTGIGYWPLDEGSGTTTEDQAGDNDGTLVNGPTWITGQSGNALRFDGSEQFVDTGAPVLDTSGSYTAAAWVRLASKDGFATAVSQDGENESAFFLQYSGADDRFAFSFAGIRALAPTAPETGRWYHLVGVRDAVDGSLTLYVDGERAGEAGACLRSGSNGNTVIGRAKFGGEPVDHWRGAIDQVHVYDHALSADEVAELYASGN